MPDKIILHVNVPVGLDMYLSSSSLEKLVLSQNAITDNGVQKMTTPHRMFRNGPEHLLHIDLTGMVFYALKLNMQWLGRSV